MYKENTTTSKFLRITHYLENGLLVTLLAVMIGLAVSQILLRNFFGSGITWATPLLGILVLWIGLAGSIVASREKNHISINVLSHYLPKKTALFAQIAVEFFTAIVCSIITYHSIRFVVSEYNENTLAFESIPAWICILIIPVAFAIISVRYFAHAVESIKRLYTLSLNKSSNKSQNT